MNKEEQSRKKTILEELIAVYYDGSFIRMTCEYIRDMDMEGEKVDALLDAIKKEFIKGYINNA